LLAHPLHALSRPLAVGVLIVLVASAGAGAATLPLPIGPLSDYGNVLNRHGRERILSLIDAEAAHHGIAVHILASWENPYQDLDLYAHAILDDWGLASGKTLLAVFLRQDGTWFLKIVAGAKTAAAYPGLAQAVEAGLGDLVAHDRIEEAMVRLFALLDARLAGSPAAPVRKSSGHVGRVLLIVAFVIAVLAAAVFIHRRICPRCGRVLRVREQRSFGLYGRTDTVYYCPRCGFTRTRRRGPGSRGR
jgi:predicted RNA-binding Zn-ribbon protein involved in translation (DUF1610 family)